MTYLVSTVVVLLIATGLYFRKRRPERHFKFMISAFVVDLALVLYVEITRQAVETAVSSTSPIVLFHAGVSVAVLLCYVTMLTLGWRVLHGRHALVNTHRNIGWTFCALRSLNYVTAFVV